MRRKGEVSIPGDAQDFRVAIQGNHIVTYLDLRVQVRLVGVRGEQGHRWLMGGDGELLPARPLHQGFLLGDGAGCSCQSRRLQGQRHRRDIVPPVETLGPKGPGCPNGTFQLVGRGQLHSHEVEGGFNNTIIEAGQGSYNPLFLPTHISPIQYEQDIGAVNPQRGSPLTSPYPPPNTVSVRSTPLPPCCAHYHKQ